MESIIVKLLWLREKTSNSDLKEEIGAYYLHYHSQNHSPSELLLNSMDGDFHYNSEEFREVVYSEIQTKYLTTDSTMYDPLMVIIGIRLKIEEVVFHSLPADQQIEFLETHKTIKKLLYAEQKGIDIPELYYLL